MNSSMDLQNMVKEAVGNLYHHPDDAVRTLADRWLQDFQCTIDAWQGELVSLFANNQNKITCDPEMEKEIDTLASTGRATLSVLLLA